MIRKWVTRFRTSRLQKGGTEDQQLPVSAINAVRRTSLLEHLEQQEFSDDLLMESILAFRTKTRSLDYLRQELEILSEGNEGERRLLKGFVHTIQGK